MWWSSQADHQQEAVDGVGEVAVHRSTDGSPAEAAGAGDEAIHPQEDVRSMEPVAIVGSGDEASGEDDARGCASNAAADIFHASGVIEEKPAVRFVHPSAAADEAPSPSPPRPHPASPARSPRQTSQVAAAPATQLRLSCTTSE